MVERCSCTFVAPRRHGERIRAGYGKYVTYLDYIEDDSVIDPACPFHGENGSMVARIEPTRSQPPVGAVTRSLRRSPSRGRNERS